MSDDLSDMSTVEHFEYSLDSTFASELSNNSSVENCDNFDYITKGLHLCNLIFPKNDEIRLSLSNTNSPDIFGICESFLQSHHADSLIPVGGFNVFWKDRCGWWWSSFIL